MLLCFDYFLKLSQIYLWDFFAQFMSTNDLLFFDPIFLQARLFKSQRELECNREWESMVELAIFWLISLFHNISFLLFNDSIGSLFSPFLLIGNSFILSYIERFITIREEARVVWDKLKYKNRSNFKFKNETQYYMILFAYIEFIFRYHMFAFFCISIYFINILTTLLFRDFELYRIHNYYSYYFQIIYQENSFVDRRNQMMKSKFDVLSSKPNIWKIVFW